MAKNLQADVLKAIVAKQSAVDDVVVLKSIDSTNSWCLQQCATGKALPFICFAEEQTAGRGRRGKQWIMSARSNIAMSIAWPFVVSNQSLQLLPLSIALAIVETLESLSLKHVQIKWPNDVYVQGEKIAGILIETQSIKNGCANSQSLEGSRNNEKQVAVVIGIGLNYDMSMHDKTAPNELLVLTDIYEQVKSQKIEVKPERDSVAMMLQRNVVAACQEFQHGSKENLEKFRAQYDYCKDKNVEIILDNKEVFSGVAQGVNDSAELLVLIDGQQRVFNSAEVSVKA